MQTKISAEFDGTTDARAAEAVLRSCVHCGICNATCPTYQVLGDELDGPRGRIYLIKQLLEGGEVGSSTQKHLDRCLTCLNCETICPSGVQYGKLISIGRKLVDERVKRPILTRMIRWALREGLTSALFPHGLRLGQAIRGLLPNSLTKNIPPAPAPGAHRWPATRHHRKMMLLTGCVQPAMMPNINSATARVLDAAEIETVIAKAAGCCGALRVHLSDHDGGLADARRNIDAWWPMVSTGAIEAIVVNASACGLAVKQYGDALSGNVAYAEKAVRISNMTRDLTEVLAEIVAGLAAKISAVRAAESGPVAIHTPCTLQHGQRLGGTIEVLLRRLGFEVQTSSAESHLCCGSAGTYSVLHPALSRELRDRKLSYLISAAPKCVVSANIGCIQHLQGGTGLPVRHWVEVVDEALCGT